MACSMKKINTKYTEYTNINTKVNIKINVSMEIIKTFVNVNARKTLLSETTMRVYTLTSINISSGIECIRTNDSPMQ